MASADDSVSRKPNVRFSDSSEGHTKGKAAAPVENEGAKASAKEPAACVTPAQQRRETPQQPPSETEHQDVAMNLAEQARKEEEKKKESVDADVVKAFNNPSDVEETDGGTPV